MFCIIRTNGSYYHNKGRIILFGSQKEADDFIKIFVSYSTERLMREGYPMEGMKAPMIIMSESQIMPVAFDINNVECGVVYASDLMNNI